MLTDRRTHRPGAGAAIVMTLSLVIAAGGCAGQKPKGMAPPDDFPAAAAPDESSPKVSDPGGEGEDVSDPGGEGEDVSDPGGEDEDP